MNKLKITKQNYGQRIFLDDNEIENVLSYEIKSSVEKTELFIRLEVDIEEFDFTESDPL